MRVEPAALAKAIGALDEVDLEQGLGPSVLQLLAMTKHLLAADGVGLIVVDAGLSAFLQHCGGGLHGLRSAPPQVCGHREAGSLGL